IASARLLKPVTGEKNWFNSLEDKIEQGSTWLIDKIHRGYHPIISRSLNNKVAVIFIALILLAGAGFTFAGMGGVFIPDLDEGDIAMQALLKPGSSLSESVEVSQKIDRKSTRLNSSQVAISYSVL